MEKKIYRVGIIGAGGIARFHSGGYNTCAQTEIVAACDIREEQVKKYGQDFGITALYTNHIQMLEKEKPDIVSICTYVDSHCALTVDAAERGVKGILCEKPMALSMAQANKMVEVCEKNGVQLAIGHQRRFALQHQKAKNIIDSGEIGNLLFLWGSSPNDLMDWGTHVIDMMRFYAGDVEWVMGQIARIDKNPRHPRGYYTVNIAEGYMKFKNGARGILETDMQRTRIWVQGEKGEIEVLMDGGLKYFSETNPQWTAPNLEGRGDTNTLEVEALVESIETGKEHLCSGKEGRAATEVLLAISESSHRRSLVRLPLEQQEAPLDVMVAADEV